MSRTQSTPTSKTLLKMVFESYNLTELVKGKSVFFVIKELASFKSKLFFLSETPDQSVKSKRSNRTLSIN